MKIVYIFLSIGMGITLCNAMDDGSLRPVKRRLLDRWQGTRQDEAVQSIEQSPHQPEETPSDMALANENIQQEVVAILAHKSVRTEAPFRCTCGKRFYNKRMVAIHKKMHRELKRI